MYVLPKGHAKSMKTILILAHPGHELRIFHWMELSGAVVCLLTDGSGGSAASRTDYSRRAVAAAGAEVGPVFGPMSDKAWYEAILAQDSEPFRRVVDAVVAAARGASSVTVIADAVDGYNPVHDLTSAVGAAVAARLRASHRKVISLVSAAVPGVAGRARREILLDTPARERKAAAIHAYAPLAEEARRIFDEAPESFGKETLLEQDFGWPDDFEPHWEKFARERVATGRYLTPITYRDHVLPMARAILDHGSN
ncbi:MAG: hypothetical protein ABS58_05955 [Mesorhizobium sp. SCN 65-20]|nr:MAG: hypothetical protein ABS58_05955 [Mesorhizobium sp. SCN 65-20]